VAKILIEGHTDSTGTEQRNIVLSNDRAESVLHYFVQKAPYLIEKISALGKASNFPIAENNTVEGRAKNRRVHIILTYTLQKQ
jgi:outer membrane protein OmpA-like peptidoglycan-associated protein